jgi:hypothetical protein
LDWMFGESAPVRLIEHSRRKEFGTGFGDFRDGEAAWLVACGHVVDPRAGEFLSVGGQSAEVVANGREESRTQKIDLAVLRVPGLRVHAVLPLAPLLHPQGGCQIPGWRDQTNGSYRGACLDAQVGKPHPWTEPGSSLVARAFELSIQHEGRLAKGYSGAPAICSETGEVFAVVATKEESSTSGSAICIAHLLDIWPEMPAELRAALAPSELGSELDQEIRGIFGAFGDTVSAQEIRAVCARSIPAELHLTPPAEDSAEGYADWLPDRPRLAQNDRHPLYDVLAYLQSRAGADEPLARRVAKAMQELTRHHPGLVTEPLRPVKPEAVSEPALVEIVFEPRTSTEAAAYDGHTFWHRPLGAGVQAGPRREHDDGGRLDLGSGDQIADFACELMQALDAWDVDADEILFLFRVPNELLLQPFEHWSQDVLNIISLGYDYPVVVGLRERRLTMSRQLWEGVKARLGKRLRDNLWCADVEISTLDRSSIAQAVGRIDRAACVALPTVPEVTDAKALTLLTLLAQRGVPVALWPRSEEAAKDFCRVMDQSLGSRPLGLLPLAVRDLRKENFSAQDSNPAHEHLTLLWDDPNRSAIRAQTGRFFTGVA